MEKKMLSIVDIAKLAGVSTATVSHVLNRSGRFSKATEEKVMQIVNRYGYISNNAARSLKSSSSHTIGLIIPNINNDFFSSIAVSIEQYFDTHDYSLIICNTDNDPDKEARYFRKLDSMQVDGVIVISCRNMLDKGLLSRDIPIMLLDRTPVNNMDLPIVSSNPQEGIYLATRKLIEKGCRDIIFISSFLATYVTTNRKEGYLKAMLESGLHAGDDTIIQLRSGPSLYQAETAVAEYIEQGKKVDGIVCTSDNQAIGAMAALKRLNRSIPNEVKVFGFDNQLQSRICSPSLSTIERYPSDMGKTAAENLLKLIRNEKTEKKTVIPCSLVERESTA